MSRIPVIVEIAFRTSIYSAIVMTVEKPKMRAAEIERTNKYGIVSLGTGLHQFNRNPP
jgi:hypothetical protein